MSEQGIMTLVLPIAEAMAHLPVEHRIILLTGLLAQEICTLPASERDEEMHRLLREFPGILDVTEAGMREALAANARAGL